MSIISLVFRNLFYYRKPYLAILAGTVISTAVLTGALVVGDSVRYSLGQLTEMRLGKSRFALQAGDRFFRQKLADELSVLIKSPVVPLLQFEGMAINNDSGSRINRVDVIGIDDHFMGLWKTSILQPAEDEAIISQNTAEKLKLKPGNEFILKIHKRSKASENAPFVSEEEPLVTFRLKVAAIAFDQEMGRFSLKSNQSAPFNIFISLPALARKVELDGEANLMLVEGNEKSTLSSAKLDSLLRLTWQPEDVGLEFEKLPVGQITEIRSERIFIEDNTSKAIESTVPGAQPVLTYLVNEISSKDKYTPYSFVTAANHHGIQLSEKEIIINNWLASDLSVKTGDSLQLKFFKMGALRKLTEDSSRFCIKAVLPIENPIFDRTLMPDFPGMSDAGNCRDWETGAPVNLDKIRDKDEEYWNDHKGTPKAFISHATGQKLWDNAFGHATAYRFTSDSLILPKLKTRLMNQLTPAENGLRFQDVYSEGKSAAAKSTDFGSLFLSLSFFIIFAAILLTALLFSLHAQKRMAETAVLATIGFRKKQILTILFLEVSAVVIAGSIPGVVCGILYNKLMLLGLNTIWQDAVRTSMLQMHLLPGTLIIGLASGIISSSSVLLIVLVRNLRKPLSLLVKGVEILSLHGTRKRRNISLIIAIASFLLAGILIVISLGESLNIKSGNFLSAGGLILISGIAALYASLQNSSLKTRSAFPALSTIIMRNIGLKKNRSITAVALLAIGTFSIIITGANRKTFYGTENSNPSGTGGFLFWTESTVPLLNDLNSSEGKEKYGLSDEMDLQNAEFVQMLSLDGNDASCLNLNQVSQPKILGVSPQVFDLKQSFSFANLDMSVNKQHPWLALDKPLAPGVIPAFADLSVITWGMQKKIGDTLLYTDESGKILKVKLLGGLDNSIFQGNILVSAELFMQYFPSVGGSKVMLIDGEFKNRDKISERMEYLFEDYGMVITPASERLEQFNSVENTYLTVFMLLGGLGVILGTFGFGVVVLRSIYERHSEIALYQAIGFNQSYITRILVAENLLILLFGVFIGILAALTGLLPSISGTSTSIPVNFIVAIVILVMLNGILWVFFPVKTAITKNIIHSLKPE